MNAKALLAIAAFASIAAGAARADEADASQFAVKHDGNRTRAEVMAEASTVAATRSFEPAGSRVIAAPKSGVETAKVRAEAVQALRLGQIAYGDSASM
ncbi:MAG: DUF4148 domain-containing protein [Burkholderiaceae bacterium]